MSTILDCSQSMNHTHNNTTSSTSGGSSQHSSSKDHYGKNDMDETELLTRKYQILLYLRYIDLLYCCK